MDVADGSMVSIDINGILIHEIKQDLLDLPGDLPEAEKFTIFRAPEHIREKNKELFKPRMVSIGPYYHGHYALQAMEKHKLCYLRDYLSRTRYSIESCISELRKLESRARRCYFEEVNLQSNEFLKMMLLDGCFIIEFLIKWYLAIPDEISAKPLEENIPDEILDVGWVKPSIRNDLLLLENQIPFFVIEKLFSLIPYGGEESTAVSTSVSVSKIAPLKEMLILYLSEGKKAALQVLVVCEIKHILHLYHLCQVCSPSPNKLSTKKERLHPKSTNERFPRIIPSATELQEAGVIFKSSKSENILDIKFQNGTLEIPFISIEDTRRSRLLNLVSFEQCDSKLGTDMTSYASFMGALFKTHRDVTLLQEKGIIDNLLATNEELVSFFNWLSECSYLDYKAHYLKELIIDVNSYYNSVFHKWRATLKREYFSNPWSTISVTAAFALMALTFLQTLYTILSYYHTN